RNDRQRSTRKIQRVHRARSWRRARARVHATTPSLAVGVSEPRSHHSLDLPVHEMMRILFSTAIAALVLVGVAAQQPAPESPSPQPPQQPSEISTVITGAGAGTPPRFAVPDFIALSNDAETVDAAQTIGRVLWDDLNFEHEFGLIPHDAAATV